MQSMLLVSAASLILASRAKHRSVDMSSKDAFFDALSTPGGDMLVTGPSPYYALLTEFEVDKARRNVEGHLVLPLQVARNAAR